MIDIMDVIEVGDKLKIVEKKSDEILFLETSVARKNLETESFDIYNPIYKKRLYLISDKKKYTFGYIDKRSGIYLFEGLVQKRYREGKLYFLNIKFLGNVEKHQRREYFRIELYEKIILKEPLDENINTAKDLLDNKDSIDFKSSQCLLKDVSGGGLGFFSDVKYPINKLVLIEFDLGSKTLEVVSQIVRVVPELSGDHKYLVGVKFMFMDSKIRSSIVSFIFDKQRELRKKGLI